MLACLFGADQRTAAAAASVPLNAICSSFDSHCPSVRLSETRACVPVSNRRRPVCIADETWNGSMGSGWQGVDRTDDRWNHCSAASLELIRVHTVQSLTIYIEMGTERSCHPTSLVLLRLLRLCVCLSSIHTTTTLASSVLCPSTLAIVDPPVVDSLSLSSSSKAPLTRCPEGASKPASSMRSTQLSSTECFFHIRLTQCLDLSP